jgi:hypothetical protein
MNAAQAMLTLSTRHPGGENAPVFSRSALKDPRTVGSTALIADGAALRVVSQRR